MKRDVPKDNSVSSLYIEVPLAQDASHLNIGERTNANGSKAFREHMLAGNWDECVEIAKSQARDGAHVLDLCIDYVGRDGAADMDLMAARLATAVTLPVVLDSTEPPVIQAGLERLAGRCIINSVNYEDGAGPESRFGRIMPMVQEHGAAVVALTIDEEGQARTAEWKVRVASRLIDDLTGNWGMDVGDILVDCLTFPIATGQEETRRDGIETIEAIRELKQRYPRVRTTLGVSNVSFGLNPAARMVLNSVFLHECVKAGLDSAIVHSAKIIPMDRIPDEQREVALDLVWDRRREDYDPLTKFLDLFEGVTAASVRASRAAELASLPLEERLQRRIIDGEGKGLQADLDEALGHKPALDIINSDLLAGMKVVGELFGSARCTPPFVLQSAEVMKSAVAHLEPHMEKKDTEGKGTLVLATVRGDVHDIGKNLVDIIVSNNGYTVVNIGIKQPINAIIEAAEKANADAIGMSGLLVKSTIVMKDNLAEINRLGLAEKYPVLLGGAALTRAFVEHDLGDMFEGEVRYARDAFDGLALMDAVMAVKQGVPGAALPAIKPKRVYKKSLVEIVEPELGVRSDVARRIDVPTPPFWGSLWCGQGHLPGRGQRVARPPRHLHGPVGPAWGARRRQLRRSRPDRGPAAAADVAGPHQDPGPRRLRRRPRLLARPQPGRDAYRRPSRRSVARADPFHLPAPAPRQEAVPGRLLPRCRRISRAWAGRVGHATGHHGARSGQGRKQAVRGQLLPRVHGAPRAVRAADGGAGRVLAPSHQDRAGAGRRDGDVKVRSATRPTGAPLIRSATRPARIWRTAANSWNCWQPHRIGVELSEELQLHPEQSTDAIVVQHPEAKYFSAKWSLPKGIHHR